MNAHLAGSRTECVTGEVPVLMYHSIGAATTREFGRFAVDPAEFAEQMDYLDAAGYRTMTAADLAASRRGRPLPPRPVVLTFDDAYADFYSTALPVLRDHDFCATLYVPTGYVGGTASFLSGLGEGHRPVLSWQALRDIAAAEVEVAAHSHTHPQLDRVPAAVINDEVRRSRCLLEDNLGLAVDGLLPGKVLASTGPPESTPPADTGTTPAPMPPAKAGEHSGCDAALMAQSP